MHACAQHILRHDRVTSAATLNTYHTTRQTPNPHKRTPYAPVRVLLCVRSFVRGANHKLPCLRCPQALPHALAPEDSLDFRRRVHNFDPAVRDRWQPAEVHPAGPVCKIRLARYAVEPCAAPKLHFSAPSFCQEPRGGARRAVPANQTETGPVVVYEVNHSPSFACLQEPSHLHFAETTAKIPACPTICSGPFPCPVECCTCSPRRAVPLKTRAVQRLELPLQVGECLPRQHGLSRWLNRGLVPSLRCAKPAPSTLPERNTAAQVLVTTLPFAPGPSTVSERASGRTTGKSVVETRKAQAATHNLRDARRHPDELDYATSRTEGEDIHTEEMQVVRVLKALHSHGTH